MKPSRLLLAMACSVALGAGPGFSASPDEEDDNEGLPRLVIVEEGSASADPACVTVGVTVTSTCYATSKSVKTETDTLTNDLIAAYGELGIAREKVSSEPTWGDRQNNWIYDNAGGRPGPCHNRWTMTQELSADLTDISKVSEAIERLYDVIDRYEQKHGEPQASKPLTTARVRVTPQVDKKILRELELGAYRDAIRKALQRRDVFADECGLTDADFRLVLSRPASQIQVSNGKRASYESGASGDANTTTTIQFKKKIVPETWEFTYSYPAEKICRKK